MSRTTKFSVSLWLAIPLVAVAGELAMAANHAPVLDPSKSVWLATENWNSGVPSGPIGTLVSTLVDFAVPAGEETGTGTFNAAAWAVWGASDLPGRVAGVDLPGLWPECSWASDRQIAPSAATMAQRCRLGADCRRWPWARVGCSPAVRPQPTVRHHISQSPSRGITTRSGLPHTDRTLGRR
jgi:hypothetical protein